MVKRPSISHVNLLLLIVLGLQASNVLFFWLPNYVRMILNQALFILLPAFIYLRWAGLPVRETLQWRWPGWKIAGLSFVIGAGLYPLAIYSADLYQALLGYTLPEMPELIPSTPFEALLAFVAFAVMAPICEEVLFRGIVQNAYAHWGPLRVILFVGLLFMAFHLALLQGLSIIPLVLVLGFVYWRTASLPASMLTHFGANVLAALVITQRVWIQSAGEVILAFPTAIAGLGLVLLSLGLLVRLTRPAPPPDAPVTERGWLARSWPLLAALPIWLIFIGLEVFVGYSPELFAQPVVLNPLPWVETQTWHYQIYNVIDDPIGEATCTLAPETQAVTLTCWQDQQEYEVQVERSYWYSQALVGERMVRWDRESYAPLLDLSDFEAQVIQWMLAEQAITVEATHADAEMETWVEPLPLLAQDTLVTASGIWPWQLAALTFEEGVTARLLHLSPNVWRQATQDSGPVLETMLVKVIGVEAVETTFGSQDAWRVEVGEREIAWYTTTAPRTLLRYFNGMDTWVWSP